ncbi:hypothetical protein [Haloarcula argentinensis]|uniref:Uncharacterized protein n=1 Tax=Haloarcula argentinensis TaxID=43776 RepID=A0A847UPD9_HALAR|nr:hypothetical protein [Haloarcula argentinensis]NLV14387.1 hypothetical protein [Haloarcula argentinensis]
MSTNTQGVRMSNSAPTETSEQPAITGEATDDSAADVDWAALWDEFGFDTPDAAGNKMASDTQLEAALQATEQSIAGDSEGHINEAVADGSLVKCRAEDGTLRGYAFVGGEQ